MVESLKTKQYIMTIEEYAVLSIKDKEKIPTIYFLFEGLNTEESFINGFIESFKDALFGKVNIIELKKHGAHEGLTDFKSLYKIAKEQTKKICFDKTIDKIIIFFDLDQFNNNQDALNSLLDKTSKNIILAYGNPMFELFIMLLFENSLEELILPHEKEIVANQYVTIGNKKERYIYHLLKESLNIESKKRQMLQKIDYRNLYSTFALALENESKINRYLNKASYTLTCNICYILNKLLNLDLDNIDYFLKEASKEKKK